VCRANAPTRTGRSRDWRPQGAEFFDLESPRASHGGLCGSRMTRTKGVKGNEIVAIWPEKICPVLQLQQCTRVQPIAFRAVVRSTSWL
jgi:hypothetical protein